MKIERDYYLNKLVSKKNNCLIKVVTGIRRCGKSYLLNTIFKNYLLENDVSADHIIFIALDDVSNDYLLELHKLSEFIHIWDI